MALCGKKLLGLCQFVHETQQFFELFEILGTSDSLNLKIFRYLDLMVLCSKIFKYLKLAVL
jgi:hypothetical protein